MNHSTQDTEESGVLNVSAAFNSLNLVMRDEGLMKFIKVRLMPSRMLCILRTRVFGTLCLRLSWCMCILRTCLFSTLFSGAVTRVVYTVRKVYHRPLIIFLVGAVTGQWFDLYLFLKGAVVGR